MANLQLSAESREVTGRKVKQLRAQGIVPVVVYGATQEPLNLQVDERTFERALHAGGATQLVEVTVQDGKMHNVLVREVQRHPVNHRPIHADFYAVNMLEKQQVFVPIHSVGEPAALVAGVMVLQALDQVELEALPASIPAQIEIDITDLTLEQAVLVSDLPQIEGVEYLTSGDEVVFNMIAIRMEEEEEEEEELLDGELAEPELVGAEDDDTEE